MWILIMGVFYEKHYKIFQAQRRVYHSSYGNAHNNVYCSAGQ
jgi:hypothetical protein